MIRTLAEGEADYPRGLCDLAPKDRPATISVEGDFSATSSASLRVAIVGSRVALEPVVAMVQRLANAVASVGGVVISGGAEGVDAAAHEGALAARGRTWAVLGCGPPNVTPPKNEKLFRAIASNGGAIVWPFPRETPAHNSNFLKRNGVLVALADVVLVAQAAFPSGTLNAARWARDLKRPLWAAVGPPWLGASFRGSWRIVDTFGATVLRAEEDFVENVLGVRQRPPPHLTPDERVVFQALGSGSKHPDELTCLTGLPASAVATALLTLALGDVVVEGSAGLFRRKTLVTG